MDETLLVNVFEPVYELFKEVEDHLSIYYVILIVKKFS